jgi:hypothetical protein
MRRDQPALYLAPFDGQRQLADVFVATLPDLDGLPTYASVAARRAQGETVHGHILQFSPRAGLTLPEGE